MGRAKGLSAADLRLWAAYSQTLSWLMPGKQRLPVEPEPMAAAAPVAEAAPLRAKPSPPGFVGIDMTPVGIDKSTWKKFATGKIRAERRLDLHGHTAARAHHAVRQFIDHAYAGQSRCIEIITGKGEVLARELPHWLNAPGVRGMILAIAHPHTGNTGSVRILLRRAR